MKSALPIIAASAPLAACAPSPVPIIDPPRLDITCADPAARARLGDGSTYRDLARSRAEALRGWSLCHDALNVATRKM